MEKIVTFGEIMLRLAPPSYQRFTQARSFEAVYGGGEANVAVSLANYGEDVEFVTRMTDNFGQWAKQLEKYTPGFVESVTGIARKDLQRAALMLAGAEEASIVYGNGITQHTAGTDSVVAIANLAMLTGNTGRHGGIFALQRENNAHGACDMGTLPGFPISAGWRRSMTHW